MNTQYDNVDNYIMTFPPEVQTLLQKVRTIIKENAPEAKESIAYGMPAYKINGKPLLYFAGFNKHIGFYALPAAHSQFAGELSAYKRGKGSVQFPLNKPLPFDLIGRIVIYRVKEVTSKFL
jgi:uncharacterized protein YdhG (YjbR/CyaY superfamily)